MAPLTFDDLTPEELEFLSNGCGPKVWGLKVPDLVFRKDCDRHDFDYWSGFTREDRYKADRRFLKSMLESANQITGWFSGVRRRWYRFWAWRYYLAVRALGKGAFNHGRKGYGSREDLEQEIADSANEHLT